MKPTGSCDCSAQQGEAFADVSVCAAHNGYRGTDCRQDGNDELDDVLNSFLLFHNFIWCFVFTTDFTDFTDFSCLSVSSANFLMISQIALPLPLERVGERLFLTSSYALLLVKLCSVRYGAMLLRERRHALHATEHASSDSAPLPPPLGRAGVGL